MPPVAVAPEPVTVLGFVVPVEKTLPLVIGVAGLVPGAEGVALACRRHAIAPVGGPPQVAVQRVVVRPVVALPPMVVDTDMLAVPALTLDGPILPRVRPGPGPGLDTPVVPVIFPDAPPANVTGTPDAAVAVAGLVVLAVAL